MCQFSHDLTSKGKSAIPQATLEADGFADHTLRRLEIDRSTSEIRKGPHGLRILRFLTAESGSTTSWCFAFSKGSKSIVPAPYSSILERLSASLGNLDSGPASPSVKVISSRNSLVPEN